MKNELSILIPTYNNICVDWVKALHKQAQSIMGLNYEIIVADDGSTDKSIVNINEQINDIDHCRYIKRTKNVGRAAIRNFLAQTAHYEWLLFVDSGIYACSSDFLMKYLSTDNTESVIYGGLSVAGNPSESKSNLRYLYEKKCEKAHSTKKRSKRLYQSFRTVNFFTSKQIMTSTPFDEAMNEYGYEDVLWGKALKASNINITHIENPVAYRVYDDNATFISKTEEALRTLHKYRMEMRGYSNLLVLTETLKKCHIAWLLQAVCSRKMKTWRARLCGDKPSVKIYNLYRIGYLLSLSN